MSNQALNAKPVFSRSVPANERRTLDELLRFWANQHGHEPALSNPALSAKLRLGSPGHLDYASAKIIVDQIAARFLSQGLAPGDAIAIQLPNTAELPLIILGAIRAGLIACPIPMLWRAHEIEQAFAGLPVRGIVSVDRFAGHAHGDMMCEVAAGHLTVRFIYGVGRDLSDGQTPISDLFDPTISYTTGLDVFQDFPDNDVEDVTLVSWTITPAGPKPVLWTHRELIAAGLQHVLGAAISTQDRLLNPYPLSNIVGITGLFVPWLLSGTQLSQHHPFSYEDFLCQLVDDEVTYTVLPAAISDALACDGRLTSGAWKLSRVGSVRWPHQRSGEAVAAQSFPFTIHDILNLNDIACIISRRENGRAPAALELGEIQSLDGPHGRLVLLETRLRGRIRESDGAGAAMIGSLLVRGLAVPNTVTVTSLGHFTRDVLNSWIDTGLECTLGERARESAAFSQPQAFIYHGGAIVRAAELDSLYSGYEAFDDAAALPIDDPVMGTRILAAAVPASGATPDLAAFKAYLEQRQISSFKVPEQIVLVDEIPRDARGQILRDALIAGL